MKKTIFTLLIMSVMLAVLIGCNADASNDNEGEKDFVSTRPLSDISIDTTSELTTEPPKKEVLDPSKLSGTFSTVNGQSVITIDGIGDIDSIDFTVDANGNNCVDAYIDGANWKFNDLDKFFEELESSQIPQDFLEKYVRDYKTDKIVFPDMIKLKEAVSSIDRKIILEGCMWKDFMELRIACDKSISRGSYMTVIFGWDEENTLRFGEKSVPVDSKYYDSGVEVQHNGETAIKYTSIKNVNYIIRYTSVVGDKEIFVHDAYKADGTPSYVRMYVENTSTGEFFAIAFNSSVEGPTKEFITYVANLTK